MATWPATLPRPLIDGYDVNPFDQTLRQSFESGPGRARRRFFTPFERINVAWRMTEAQFTEFRTWFLSASGANGGAAWFDIEITNGRGGMATTNARFGGAYRAAPFGATGWKVSAVLEVRDA